MKYDIVESLSADTLVKVVNKKIENGWEPIGGVLRHGSVFYQSMIKKDKTNAMPNV